MKRLIDPLIRIFRATLVFITWASFFMALAVLSVRYLILPSINESKEFISGVLTKAVGQPISVGEIKGAWMGYRPELSLRNVSVLESGNKVVLELGRVDAVISLAPLLTGKIVFHALEIFNPALSVRRDAKGVIWVAGAPLSDYGYGGNDILRKWISEQRQILVHDAVIHWKDDLGKRPEASIRNAELRIDNYAGFHKIGLSGNPPSDIAETLIFRTSFKSRGDTNFSIKDGDIFLELKAANIESAIIQEYGSSLQALTLKSGFGDIRLWGGIADDELLEVTADVNLSNLVFLNDINSSDFALNRLIGILKWRHDSRELKVTGRDILFEYGNKANQEKVNFNFSRQTDVETSKYQFKIDALDLSSFFALANKIGLHGYIPKQITSHHVSGLFYNTKVGWEYKDNAFKISRLKTDVQGLNVESLNGETGMWGIDGQLDIYEGDGKIAIESKNLSFMREKTLLQKIDFTKMDATVDWKWDKEKLNITSIAGSYKNNDMKGTFQGGFGTEKDIFEVELKVNEILASRVWKYFPSKAPRTSEWMRGSIKSGIVYDAKIIWSAPIAKVLKTKTISINDLQGSAFVKDIELVYGVNWPAINGLSGQIKLAGREISMAAQSGKIYNLNMAGSTAKVYRLGTKREYMVLAGRGSGLVGGFHKFIIDSPLGRNNIAIFNKIAGNGVGHVAFEYIRPFGGKGKPRVSGDYQSSGSSWSLGDKMPKLTSYQHKIFFDGQGIRKGNGSATFLGDQLTYNIARNKQGEVSVDLKGGLKTEVLNLSDSTLTSFLKGTSSWSGNVRKTDNGFELKVQSKLKGISSSLPHPFRKESGDLVHANLQVNWLSGGQRVVELKLLDIVTTRLTEIDGKLLGVIAIGKEVQVPEGEAGLELVVALNSVDLDHWRQVFSGKQGSFKGLLDKNKLTIDKASFRIGSIKWLQRRFNNIDLTVQKEKTVWQGSFTARQGRGKILWSQKNKGKIVARFDKLHIPARSMVKDTASNEKSDMILPSMDIVAKDFSFEGKSLGVLELVADPTPDNWNLKLLGLSNIDGKILVTGKTTRENGVKTELQVVLNAFDIGKFLTRMGYSKGVDGGQGTLTGDISWSGFPYNINYQSLGGKIQIAAKDGQFIKLEPGAAKLLGILSLQALPRRLVLDFRDIFSSGFNFDTIDSNFVITDGVAITENFKMIGPAARVNMRGEIDLEKESQRLNVEIFPQLSAAAAVAGAAVVNPAVGVATYVIQKIFGDPVEKIASKRYLVTGKWGEPNVDRLDIDDRASGVKPIK